jgi:fermentation-respiration switch protein FrsA (DUF1100 family)
MGAVTAIMYMSENHEQVAAAILDSGFSSIEDIIDYLGFQVLKLNKILVGVLSVALKANLYKAFEMKLEELKTETYAPECKTPALFIHGIDDKFIDKSHTERNYEAYGGSIKEVRYSEGDHNDERPRETI